MRLFADIAALFGPPPAHAVAIACAARRDPISAAGSRDSLEHFMNIAAKDSTMWRNSDSIRPPEHHRERPARHAGHRPRMTSGQRLAQALFDTAGPLARLVRHGETQWASATFTGARHTFVLRFAGRDAVAAAEALTIAISEDAITIQRALIAELTVTRFTQTLLPEPAAEIEITALLLDQ